MVGLKWPQNRDLLPVTEGGKLQPSFDCAIEAYPRQFPKNRASLSKANLVTHLLRVNAVRTDS